MADNRRLHGKVTKVRPRRHVHSTTLHPFTSRETLVQLASKKHGASVLINAHNYPSIGKMAACVYSTPGLVEKTLNSRPLHQTLRGAHVEGATDTINRQLHIVHVTPRITNTLTRPVQETLELSSHHGSALCRAVRPPCLQQAGLPCEPNLLQPWPSSGKRPWRAPIRVILAIDYEVLLGWIVDRKC